MYSSNSRASSMPFSMWKESSRSGSLINPFQPTVVRGFSKYTRMISSSVDSTRDRQLLEARRVLARGNHIVNRTGSDHHEQPRIAALQNRPDHFARLEYRLRGAGGQRQAPFDLFGRRQ